MSSYLKEHGHKTQMIFLPYDPFMYGYDVKWYEESVLDEVISLCKGTDLIGITLMTNFLDGASQITNKLKSKIDIPIVWGGVHPTVRPEECLEYVDIICIGEGEDAMLELVNKMTNGADYSGTANLWIRSNGRIIKNHLRPLARNLDIYPIPDYSLDDHHILFDGHIKPLEFELTKIVLGRGLISTHLKRIAYQTMTGRGCPYTCTYCINNTLKNLYGRGNYFRWRSIDHVMKELLWVKETMPYVGHITLSDDAFFARNSKNLKEFCKEYKEKIDLPFSCYVNPLNVTEEKIEMVIDAGMNDIQMGIESGSKRIQKLFDREKMSNERMIKALRVINKYKDRIPPPHYDFIGDVPYETDEDKIETLKFISEMPKPFILRQFSLVLFPGTKLYQMAKEDGFINDEKQQVYAKNYRVLQVSYLNLLIYLVRSGYFPSLLLKFLISKPIVKILNRPMKPFINIAFYMYRWLFKKAPPRKDDTLKVSALKS